MYREATGGENLLPDSIKNESKRGFNVRDVARAHPWTESKCSACRWSRLVRFVFHSRLQGATNQRNSHNNKHQALSLTSASDAGLSMRLVFSSKIYEFGQTFAAYMASSQINTYMDIKYAFEPSSPQYSQCLK